MSYDYSYWSNLFESIDIPNSFKLDGLNCIKMPNKNTAEVQASNYLDNTDFFWSRYKNCNIAQVYKLIQHETK